MDPEAEQNLDSWTESLKSISSVADTILDIYLAGWKIPPDTLPTPKPNSVGLTAAAKMKINLVLF